MEKELAPASRAGSRAFQGLLQLVCPACRQPLGTPASLPTKPVCAGCGRLFGVADLWLDLCVSKNLVNEHTQAAYKIYSRYYAPIALLAYLIVWRGNFLRHVAFFREILRYGTELVDLATGDGSLTRLALFTSRRSRAERVVAIDISGYMLGKAARKLPRDRTVLARGDVLQLPFGDGSVPVMSCFGGFNSFPAGEAAMREMARILAPGGVLRGSLLLLPETPWRRRLVLDWIEKGYQTEVVDEAKFGRWVVGSGLSLAHSERHGDVLLFELRAPQGSP